ncbi:D-alanine-D-alanine ligase [Clostridium tetanomorphum]|nr:D-alanine--D-alanine ligase family protein [Clostridium tetanomorphum]KAJ48903.1 D-alanyl-alanine synthetase A [Clostridium tetanomorphum DSM 665]KAJ53285.1 D-alanyl-alanine synthetase A [Clostridium tetanomorphum DSM 665]MBP1865683.1 D-alanine-D-alanine ligase [Clostridium tetanomorphum]NRS86803.1 D-alanine-D-alanine ligase [Clostridium tetanomorphum]NRZ99439.1 D-alanine-D-alanine ligase [Clostridium tetanomorphum]
MKKIAILFGGQSTEHEVSRVSAASVLKNIDKCKYEITTIGITKQGKWFKYTGKVENIENGQWENDEECKISNAQNILFNKEVDVVFPVLHGLYGEDGTIQGLCKLLDIPFVGPGVLSSALCMDKVYTKYVLENFKIKQADYVVVNKFNYNKDKQNIIVNIEDKLGYDIFIKPSNSGSSVGITKAHNREELIKGLEEALKYDRKILVEKAINAREVEVAVLGNDEPKAAVPGEILPAKEFYDYEAKYKNESSKLLIPAALDENEQEKIKEIAINIYKLLDCEGMSRIDFLIDKDTNEVYLNEVNTLPGFTKISMYPKLWKASGKEYYELIDELIELAIDRKEQ